MFKNYLQKFYTSFLFIFCFITGLQVTSAQTTNAEPEMATGFYAEGKIYVVIGVIAIVLLGIILYLIRIDRKITKIEKEVNKN